MPPYNTRSENQKRHNPHAEITEYKQSLRDFVTAWGRLTEAWETLEFAGANVPDDGTKDYPFAESFDDLYHSVIEWAHHIESQDDPKAWNVAPDVQPITADDDPQGIYRELEQEGQQDRELHEQSEKQSALDAAEQFSVRANGARVKKAALDVVAEFEAKTAAPPDDEDHNPYKGKEYKDNFTHEDGTDDYSLSGGFPPAVTGGEPPAVPVPPAQPEEPEVERSEPATESTPISAPPADVAPPPSEATIAPEVDEEDKDDDSASSELTVRAEIEAELGDPDTIEAVMEFLKEQGFLDSHGLEVKEGVWGWHEASNFATISFGAHSEYMIAPSEEAADEFANAMVRQQLEDEPELFTQSWLENYIDTDRLRDSLSSDVEEMIRESPNSYGWRPGRDADNNELVRYDEEGNEDEDGDYDSDGQRISDDLLSDEPSDEWIESKAEELLRDPLEYMRDIWGDETMKKAMEIAGVNVHEAADDAVSLDGAGHFLSSYDGNINNLPSGGVWWRHN